jgi:lipoprotein-anchoring transpeptidase ErfK/SrfK
MYEGVMRNDRSGLGAPGHPWCRFRGARTGVALVLCLVAAACQSSTPPQAGQRSPSDSSSPSPASSRARLSISPARGDKNASPGGGISVTVMHGTISSVTASSADAHVAGQLSDDGTTWQSLWALQTDTRYTVTATATDAAGRKATETSSFRTLAPTRTFSTTIFEGLNKEYGVGMPIILTFSSPIQDKAAVEHALEIRTSQPVVGAWYWDGDTTLYFRPRQYWQPHTDVHFIGHLDGVEGSPGVYGVHTLTQSFSIGRSLIAVASTVKHDVKIYLDKKLFGDWPISSGKPGDDTPNGAYLTMDKANPEEMIGPGYDIMVPWSVRFTLSGDFLHDAFWSVNDQGFTNVSHGCVNMSPANAETYYKLAIQGDPVTITGSPRGGDWGNGWTVWFLSWPDLVGGSASHEAVRAGPGGSSFVRPGTLKKSRAKAPLGTSQPGNADPTA